jgi:hypothetical protein
MSRCTALPSILLQGDVFDPTAASIDGYCCSQQAAFSSGVWRETNDFGIDPVDNQWLRAINNANMVLNEGVDNEGVEKCKVFGADRY